MKKYLITAMVVLLSLSIITGCSLFKKEAEVSLTDDELCPVSSVVLNEQQAEKINGKLPIHLYFSNTEEGKLIKEIRYIQMDEAKKSTTSLASMIVRELISGPNNEQVLKPTIPSSAELRAPVKIEGRVAIVDMTKEFVDNHPGGKVEEELTIYSIVNSLTELKEVEKVKFLINGKTVKEFKGSFKFDAEFPRNEAIIDKTKSMTCTDEMEGEAEATVELLE